MTGTSAEACADVRLELGVYLLGAIGAADRGVIDGHLACCADCRNMLAALAGLPGLLNRVTASDAGLTVGGGAAVAAERGDAAATRKRRAIAGRQNRNSAH